MAGAHPQHQNRASPHLHSSATGVPAPPLLHEFLIQDERHNFPTTYYCKDPNHFLLTEGLFTRWLKFLMPSRRQMDNMRSGFDRPQEDEFAMCMLGEGSPYLTMAFPNHEPQCQEYLDPAGMPPSRRRGRGSGLFCTFFKTVTFRNPRRLVLKSPPHTARIAVLKEMFPDALFIHIVRDPHVVFASTVYLWRTLYRTQSLQKPTYAGLEEYVLDTYTRMAVARLEEGKKLLDPGQFHEMRYEDLDRRSGGRTGQGVRSFSVLDGFQKFKPRLQQYLAGIKGYGNELRYELTPRQREEVSRRWAAVIQRYGYE